ncbi:MAG: carboxypeptidase-like regulatory domain-containing protein [Candidatus Solibacter sp.]|jgi:hypothetical protein
MERRDLVFGLLVSLTTILSAQEFRGTFSGMVTDAQGGAIGKVKIVATETRTGTKSATYSEASGAYTIPFLAPGEYEITAEAPGFKKFVRQGLALDSGQHPVIDMRLEVGAVSEALTVTADTPLIESANASVGQVITSDEVEDFPVNGRSPLMLSALALGVVSLTEAGTQVRPFDSTSNFSVGGATQGTNELLYNGAPNAAYTNQPAYSPPQEAVMQVRVDAFESDASFGHTGGGTINQIMKQGTNTFHGLLYEFNEVSALAANQFFYNKAGIARPVYRYNQYGLNASGPVWVPKVFNGKNKIFWFFAWEGVHDTIPANAPRVTTTPTNFATVPTAAERQGDLSALLKANKPGTDYTIYDPASGVVSASLVARTPFPNNVIPSNRLDPVALKLLQYYPLPNTTGQINGFQNYIVNIVNDNGYDNELSRLDLNLSDKNKLSVDFRHSYRLSGAQAGGANNYLGTLGNGSYQPRKNQGSSVDDVYTFAPTVVMDIRANWTRFIQAHASPSDGLDPTTLGFPPYIAANAEALQLPTIVFTSQYPSGGSEPSFQNLGAADDINTSDVFQLFGDVIKIHGQHTIKMGADLRDYRWSSYTFGYPCGSYSLTSNWTNGPFSTSAASPLGQDLAAFLLGLPSSGQIDLNTQSTWGSKYYAFFVQDDWRAKGNLTFNLGLRLEHETPTTERFNRAVDGFNPAAQNGIAAAAAAAYSANPIPQVPAGQFSALGGLTFASPSNPDVYQTKSNRFGPRFGFAWVPGKFGSHTVVRGGFGVFTVPIEIMGNGTTPSQVTFNQEGFSQTTQFVATNNGYLSPAATLSNPFPNGIVRPSGAAGGAATFLGQQAAFFNPRVRNPYDMRWDFGIQQPLPGKMVFEVVYIGNHAVHLPITTQLDYIPRQYLSTSPVRNQNAIDLLTGSVPNPLHGLLPNSSSLNGSTVALQQLLTPFPQYPVPSPPSSTSNGVVMQGNGAGSSYFQSLNVRLQKRLTNGLTLISNFIYSQLIERLAYLNDSDPAPVKRVSSDSRPLREVLAVTYELPIGRGKPLDLRSRLGNALVGGWKLNANLVLQTGGVLSTWGNVIYLGGPLNLKSNQPNGPAFDVTQFVTASSQQLADNIRTFNTQFGNLRWEPSKNLDMSMSKDFPFSEQRYLQLRIESFNTMNRVTFGVPNISPTSTTFGTISTQLNSPRAIQLAARLVW